MTVSKYPFILWYVLAPGFVQSAGQENQNAWIRPQLLLSTRVSPAVGVLFILASKILLLVPTRAYALASNAAAMECHRRVQPRLARVDYLSHRQNCLHCMMREVVAF